MGKYQAILLDNPNATLQTTRTLNPATLLPDMEGAQPSSMSAWKSLTKFIEAGWVCWTSHWQHWPGSCIQTGAVSWSTANIKLGMW